MSTELTEISAGPLTFWRDDQGQVQVVAGDADCIRGFMRESDTDWQVLGSPDQREEIFLAARKSILPADLSKLILCGERLLPEPGQWEEIGIEGLDFFTGDSGHVRLGSVD
jgi:hypothetical protein